MASNMSTIGFEFADDDQFVATMTGLAEAPAASAHGPYAVWHSPTGAALWFHHNEITSQIVGVTPYFEGKSSIPVRISAFFQRPGDSEFEGAISAWVAPPGAPDAYPIVFDAVDYRQQAGRTLPFDTHARIAAFAFRVKGFPSVEAFDAAQTEEVRYAPQSFVPIGMFSGSYAADGAEAESAPASHAMLNGKILEARLATNEATGRSFQVLLVESLEATFDVVADPAVVEGEIIPGGVVEVVATLFGRLLP